MGDIRSGLLACLAVGYLNPPSAFDVTAFHLALRHNRPLFPKFIDKVTALGRQLWDQVFQKEVRSHFQAASVNGDRDTTWLTIYLTLTVLFGMA
jgi:hypothetical protein